MANIMLDTILFMSNSVVTSLQLSLEYFRINGLAEVNEGNVAVVVHWILKFRMLLRKVMNLPTKTPILILEGFLLCTERNYKDTFSLLLNQDRITQLNTYVGISDTITAMLVHVKLIFHH